MKHKLLLMMLMLKLMLMLGDVAEVKCGFQNSLPAPESDVSKSFCADTSPPRLIQSLAWFQEGSGKVCF